MLKQLKNGIIHGVGFLLILGLAGISYAAFITLPTEGTGNDLTFSKWNAVIDRLNSIEQEQLATAWVNFDGTNCPGNTCTINSSYNVSSVDRVSEGKYNVNFATAMDNVDYLGFGGGNHFNRDFSVQIATSQVGVKSINTIEVRTINNGSLAETSNYEVYVSILGGKTY